MDQTLSLPHQASAPSPHSPQGFVASTLSEASPVEEDPESPGRSPRQFIPPAASPDPLAEGMALMAGVVLAVLTVLVPLAAVVSDSQRPASSETVRAGW